MFELVGVICDPFFGGRLRVPYVHHFDVRSCFLSMLMSLRFWDSSAPNPRLTHVVSHQSEALVLINIQKVLKGDFGPRG